MPRVFLSFASEDIDFVLRLFARLKQQDIEIWDYSNRSQEIALGYRISKALDEQIKLADFFLPVISFNSVDKDKWYTQYEVDYALDIGKETFPIVIKGKAPVVWMGAYEKIKGNRYLEMDHWDEADFENKLCSLCGHLGIRYKPPMHDPYLLPLFRKFEQEIDCHLSAVRELHNRALYEDLIMTVNTFNLHYSQGDWEQSYELISYLIITLRLKIKNTEFYYSLIVKGACELQLNLLDEAESTFTKALKLPDADENAYGGLGHVYYLQKQYRKALAQYQKTLEQCPEDRQSEIHYAILITGTEMLNSNDEAIRGDRELFVSVSNLIANTAWEKKIIIENYAPRDQIRILHQIALAYYKANNFRSALSLFQKIYTRKLQTFEPSLEKELDSGFVSQRLFDELSASNILIPKSTPVTCQHVTSLTPTRSFVAKEGAGVYVFKGENSMISLSYREVPMIIDYVDLLEYLGYITEATSILSNETALINDRSLFQRLAHLHLKKGNRAAARRIYLNNLCREPYERQFLVEYALLLKTIGAKVEMKTICEQTVALGNPADFSDWYYHGFAYFLMGDVPKAKFYYDSCNSYDKYYDQVPV